MREGKVTSYSISKYGILHHNGRLCVPNDEDIKRQILSEAHDTPYSIIDDATKMYQGLKENFWWNKIKICMIKYVSKCLTCQKFKAKHKLSAGELQMIKLQEWKWDQITTKFCRLTTMGT